MRLPYAAPEIIDAGLGRGKDERQADIYAAGICLVKSCWAADVIRLSPIYTIVLGLGGCGWIAQLKFITPTADLDSHFQKSRRLSSEMARM